MLITLIDKVFLNNGYEVVIFEHNYDCLIVKLYKPIIALKKAEYYLVIECLNATNQHADVLLSEWADGLHQKVRVHPEIERFFSKNCTMIICWPDHAITDKQIFQLEEDQYNFKKNVITYCLAELEEFETKTNDHTLLQLNKMVADGNRRYFQRFKEKSAGLKNYYSLLLKIFIKMPFLTYQHESIGLNNLDSSLVESLTTVELELYEFMQGISKDLTDEELMIEFLKRAN